MNPDEPNLNHGQSLTDAASTTTPGNILREGDEAIPSHVALAATMQKTLKETEGIWEEIKHHKAAISWVQTATYLGFVIVLIMVAQMVIDSNRDSNEQAAQLQQIIDQTAPHTLDSTPIPTPTPSPTPQPTPTRTPLR